MPSVNAPFFGARGCARNDLKILLEQIFKKNHFLGQEQGNRGKRGERGLY
jgi:hypothetical protein